jgi:hypothetical protein
MNALRFPLLGFLLLGSFEFLAIRAEGSEKIRFNRDIRPILSDHCFACHGFDKNKRDSGLRLDIREEALRPAKSGSAAIVPGDPEASELVTRILSTDSDDVMPPPKAHKNLSAEQKSLLQRWVAEGAIYEGHWAYAPLKKEDGLGAPETVIDHYVDRALKQKGITPSEPADPATLLRRLSLDLTGLPPSPEEVSQFEAAATLDPSRAFAAARERLLSSPHYGERWAVWWLDAVRYADTVGYHGDQTQRIFPYRDYVIDAFNTNKRFDQFTLEQIAGDLLPNATDVQKVASGFNRLSMMTREGGIQAKEYLAKYMSDRVRAVGSAWLGATIGCAECHDHKFDPITQKDFYALGAYFADIKQYALYHGVFLPNPELKGWTDHHPFPPEIEVPSRYREERRKRLVSDMERIAQGAWARQPATAQRAWDEEARVFLAQYPSGWMTPAPSVQTFIKGKGVPDSARVERDGSVVFEKNAGSEIRLRFPPGTRTLAALRTQFIPRAEYGGNLQRSGELGAWNVLPQVRWIRKDAAPRLLKLRYADADLKAPTYFQGESLPGVETGWRLSGAHARQAQTAVWLLESPLTMSEGDEIRIDFSDPKCAPASLRVSVSPFASFHYGDQALPNEFLQRPALWLESTAADPAAFKEYVAAQKDMLSCLNGRAHSMVSQSVDPYPVRILPRGNWQDESGPVVQPETLSFITALPDIQGRAQGRLDLARWLTSPQNPVTPRAIVNRLWKQFFGTGLSAVLDDLGAQGEPPSHPELLDWLAAEFQASGWDFQHMIRLIVSSKAYQRSSRQRPELKEIDPSNRLFASQNPRRLDAEFIRDNALAIAGLLNRDIGGPSSHLYFPEDLYRDMEFPKRVFEPEKDDRQWRRGLYAHWQRTFLHPMLANFDAPNRDESACLRTQANTPQQALTLLNDPSFVEAARCLAQLIVRDAGDDQGRLDLAFRRALGRGVLPEEREGLIQLLERHRQHFRQSPATARALIETGIAPVSSPASASELAAWTSVCRVVLNLHETITRY